MQQVFICEKPSLAAEVAKALGCGKRQDGQYLNNDNTIAVTYCFGHMLTLEQPDFYLKLSTDANGKKARWSSSDLPIIPKQFVKTIKVDKNGKVDPGVQNQVKLIRDLVKSAKTIVNVGDPDREGQLLVDELLVYFGIDPYGDNVKRLLISNNNEQAIKVAISKIEPNANFRRLCQSAEARSIFDWLVGMNLSRAMMVVRSEGMNIGRLIIPVSKLIVDRDRLIKNFKPVEYYVPVLVLADGARMAWAGRRTDHPGIDSEGRIISKMLAEEIANNVRTARNVNITLSQETEKSKAPPKPHSLDSLQRELSRKYSLSAKESLDIAQSLYEKHKLTTYPRTDSRNLPIAMFEERNVVLNALADYAQMRSIVQGANPNLQSGIWKKDVDVHHAIIPTGKSLKGLSLSENEMRAYDTISRHYLAQFYPNYKYLEIRVEAQDHDDTFRMVKNLPTVKGWKQCFSNDEFDDEDGVDMAPSHDKNNSWQQ